MPPKKPHKNKKWDWVVDPTKQPGRVIRKRLAEPGKQFLAEKRAREAEEDEEASMEAFIKEIQAVVSAPPPAVASAEVPVEEPDDDFLYGFGDTVERSNSDDDDDDDIPLGNGDDDSTDDDESQLATGNDRLYPDSNLSSIESSTLLLAFAKRHSLTRDATNELLSLMKLHLPEDAKVPGSTYLLEKALHVEMSSAITKCVYCKTCEASFATEGDVCKQCKSRINEKELIEEGKYFIMFDIRRSLEKLLEREEVSSNLFRNLLTRTEKRLDPDYASKIPEFYCDITDGDCYRRQELKENDITCSINTDGVNVFKSSTFAIWPIFLSINELPYKLRRNNTLLVGLWFGKKKPSFNTFLSPFVDQCNELSHDGLSWTVNGLTLRSRVFFKMISADSVARAPLQGLKQFNGKFGCPFCYNPGKAFSIKDDKGKVVSSKWIVPYQDNARLRTHKLFLEDLNILADKLESTTTENSHNGVLCCSPFVNLHDYDMVAGFVIDYMHTGLLGTLKTYTMMLIDSKNHNEPYYLGQSAQNLINSRLLNCKIPSEVNRPTRDLKEIAYWKANEWKTWLLICIPILQGILKEPYIQHLSKLIVGLTLLISDKISPKHIDEAEKLLIEFNKEAPTLYSEFVLTHNMHLLTHAAECVRRWGPLFGYSLFQFEHANGQLSKMFHGTRVVAMQIVKNATVLQDIRSFGSLNVTNPSAKLFFDSMIDHKSYYSKVFQCSNGVTFVGPRKNYTLNDQESRTLARKQVPLNEIKEVWSYKTMFFNGKRFAANESSKISNSVVKIHERICIIRKFLLLCFSDSTQTALCFVSTLIADLHKIKNFKSQLVYTVNTAAAETALKVFLCQDIQNVKFITLFNNDRKITHACMLPNSLELE